MSNDKKQLDIQVADMVLCDHTWYYVHEIDATDPNDVAYWCSDADAVEIELIESDVDLIDRAGTRIAR